MLKLLRFKINHESEPDKFCHVTVYFTNVDSSSKDFLVNLSFWQKFKFGHFWTRKIGPFLCELLAFKFVQLMGKTEEWSVGTYLGIVALELD